MAQQGSLNKTSSSFYDPMINIKLHLLLEKKKMEWEARSKKQREEKQKIKQMKISYESPKNKKLILRKPFMHENTLNSFVPTEKNKTYDYLQYALSLKILIKLGH